MGYSKILKRRLLFIFSLLFFTLFLVGVSVSLGSVELSLVDVYTVIISKIFPFYRVNVDRITEHIVWNLRMPRVLGAVVVGSALASAGAVCQAVLRNPLASPFTIGLSSAASFGASLAIILGAGVLTYSGGYTYVPTNELLVILNAFVMCVICSFIVSAIARIKGSNPTTIVLAGVAIGYFFSAGTSILQYFSQAEALKAVVMWFLGDLGRSDWRYLPWMSLAVAAIPFMVFMGWKLNALNMGDEVASSLGVNVKLLRAACIMLASFMTAVTISFVGLIGFVCLISPHIARIAVGNDNRYLVPASALVGASLLLAADTVARIIVAPLILPVGAVTSCIGGPFFVYLLLKSRRVHWA